MSARILVAGEALVDLLVPDDPRHPVACPGGSPANTAIALARSTTDELAQALDYATVAAGLACARPGADPPTQQVDAARHALSV